MGTAVAQRLAGRHRVLLADLDLERAAAVTEQLERAGAVATAIQCDVTCPQSVQMLADKVAQAGGLQVLAHVAGLSPAMGNFDQIVRVNLVGPALVVDALLQQVRPSAAAILIASLGAHTCSFSDAVLRQLREGATAHDLPERLRELIGADRAQPNIAYQLSKFGLLMLARRRARDWGARGARIVSLSPGIIATPMGALEFETNPTKKWLFEQSPLKREGTLDEIADAVEFLASERASFISGTDILVDGGLAGTLSDVPFSGSVGAAG